MTERMHNDKWLKAAVVGSLWGASEIVLGSFLHNLKIPFSGNILTAIAIILMVAGHRLWPERGVIIRAGLICAALKTMSPSPSILGPMLAITAQATIMESVLFFGRKTWLGYLAGGGMAMAWNLFHRILTSVVLYGGTLIELYKSLLDYFIRQTGWQVEGYLAPILLLAAIFFLTGAAAATAGIYISNVAEKMKPGLSPVAQGSTDNGISGKSDRKRTSQTTATRAQHPAKPIPAYLILLRIAGIILLLVAAMMGISRLPLTLAAAILLVFLVVVWMHDSRLVKRFAMKRGFWISMAIMLLLSGLLLKQDSDAQGFSLAGVRAGLEMMMRAIYVITGFGLISKELRHPGLAGWFQSRHMQNFHDAVRIAFQTTPLLIENIPGRHAWKQPVRVLAGMIGSMEDSLHQIRSNHTATTPQKNAFPMVFIISGTKGSGKTTLIKNLSEELKNRGVNIKGILAPELREKEERTGYYVQNIHTGEQMLLCKRNQSKGRFEFYEKAIAFGEQVLYTATDESRVIIIDELGPFELKGEGWAAAMDHLAASWNGPVIWVVRESLIDEMLKRWPAARHEVFHVGTATVEEICTHILPALNPES